MYSLVKKAVSATLLACLLQPLYAQSERDSTVRSTDSTIRHLDEIVIRSQYYRQYDPGQLSASLRVRTPLLKLPQSVQIIDKSLIVDQQAININESLTRNVSGAIRNNNADFYSPSIYMRGATIGTLRNGVDMSMIYFGPMPEDAAMIERIEFVKGPAGFLNAIGDPAGSFNVVTKQPTAQTVRQLGVQVGSFNLYRLTGDFGGQFGTSKRWQYRVVGVGQKAGSFQRFAFNDKVLIRTGVRYQIGSKSSLTAEYGYQYQRFQQYLTTVFSPFGFGSLPWDFSIADPAKKPASAQEHNAFLTYEYILGRQWQLTVRGAYAQNQFDGNYFFVSAYDKTTPNLIRRRVTYERYNTAVYALQAFVNGQVQTGTLRHTILGSVDLNRKTLLAYSGYNDRTANPTLYPLDVTNPVYDIPFDSNERVGALSSIATNKQSVAYQAAYLQDEVGLWRDKLRLTVAARLTAATSRIDVPSPGSVANVVLTPRFGLSYSLTPVTTIYALVDNTFTPQAGISADGGVFAPLRGRNVEAGLKKDWWGGRWNTTIAAYHIVRSNIIVSDPATTLQSQIGQTITKGIEFDLKGEIGHGLNVIINYAYTDAYVSRDANPAYVGRPSPYRVRHVQNTWLNYQLPGHRLRGFTV